MFDLFKKKITIELDDIPKASEDICLAVAKYCGENGMQYEFLKRTEPVIAIIDGTKYEIKKTFTSGHKNCKTWTNKFITSLIDLDRFAI